MWPHRLIYKLATLRVHLYRSWWGRSPARGSPVLRRSTNRALDRSMPPTPPSQLACCVCRGEISDTDREEDGHRKKCNVQHHIYTPQQSCYPKLKSKSSGTGGTGGVEGERDFFFRQGYLIQSRDKREEVRIVVVVVVCCSWVFFVFKTLGVGNKKKNTWFCV